MIKEQETGLPTAEHLLKLVDDLGEGAKLGDQIVAVRPLQREAWLKTHMGRRFSERFYLCDPLGQDKEARTFANIILDEAFEVRCGPPNTPYPAPMHMVEVRAMWTPHP